MITRAPTMRVSELLVPHAPRLEYSICFFRECHTAHQSRSTHFQERKIRKIEILRVLCCSEGAEARGCRSTCTREHVSTWRERGAAGWNLRPHFNSLACFRTMTLIARFCFHIVGVFPTDRIPPLSIYQSSSPTCRTLHHAFNACLGTHCSIRLAIRPKSVRIQRNQHHEHERERDAVQLRPMQQSRG